MRLKQGNTAGTSKGTSLWPEARLRALGAAADFHHGQLGDSRVLPVRKNHMIAAIRIERLEGNVYIQI